MARREPPPHAPQLLGQQVAEAAGRLDGPGALLEWLGPAQQLVHLTTGPRTLTLESGSSPPSMATAVCEALLGVNADHRFHRVLLGRMEATEGTPACRWLCSILL